MSGKIFINYRRDDDPGFAQAVFAVLRQKFSEHQLFFDVDSITPGRDFVVELRAQVATCDVMLSLIGKHWIGSRDDQGEIRLLNPRDFVRIEILSALEQQKWIIPVLLNKAPMPAVGDVPDVLEPLLTRNAIRQTHEKFGSDMEALGTAVRTGLAEAKRQRQGAEGKVPVYTARMPDSRFAALAQENVKQAAMEAWKEIRYALRNHGLARELPFSPEGNGKVVSELFEEGKLGADDVCLYRMLRQLRDDVLLDRHPKDISPKEMEGYRKISLGLATRIAKIRC